MPSLTRDQMNTYNWNYTDVTPGALAEGRRFPGLRGWWANSFRSTTWYDQSGFTNNLTLTGATTADVGMSTTWPGCLMPYITFDGTNDYASIADNDALSITGDMTVWCIFWPDVLGPAADQGLACKWYNTGNLRSYALWYDNNTTCVLRISQDGGTTNMKQAASAGLDAAQSWHFVCGRFQANVGISIKLDGNDWVYTTASPLSGIFDNARDFRIGEYNETAANRFAGRIAQVGICAYYVPDAMIEQWYSALKPDLGHV